MQDELTARMHSEFTITPEQEIKHRAGCVWDVIVNVVGKGNATREDIENWASKYGVSYEDCMKWKKHWLSLKE